MIEGRDFAAASTVGARERQEDDWATHVIPPAREGEARLLAAIADGMGGMPAGDRASGVALGAFLDSFSAIHLPARERLRHALAHANRELGIEVEGDPSLAGMGCTLVAALVFPDRCEWLSIGDSLLLLCRAGKLQRINPLHIYANELDERAQRGEITVEAAARDPDRNALTSVLQGTVLSEIAQGELRLEPGDTLILASDGIATLSEPQVAAACAAPRRNGAAGVAETLIQQIDIAAREGQDNATVIVVCHPATQDQDTLIVPAVPRADAQPERRAKPVVGGNTGDFDRSRLAKVDRSGSPGPTSQRPAGQDRQIRESPPSGRYAMVSAVAFLVGLLVGAILWGTIN